MTARSTTRPLVCVLLVLCLCALAPRDRRPRWRNAIAPTEFRALAAPYSTVLLTRAGDPHDHARQRPSAPSLFTLVPLHGGDSDPGRLAAAVERPSAALPLDRRATDRTLPSRTIS